MSPAQKQQYLDFAVALAHEAGVIARKYFSLDTVITNKDDNSPLTIADTQINSLIIKKCYEAFPDISILGEEERLAGTGTLRWVCDPIDGTIPYALGMPISTFCLALVEDGVPQIGVVYDFINERMFSAIKDGGAWLNGVPMARLGGEEQPMKLVNLEWWHSAPNSLPGVREKFLVAGWQAPNYASSSFCITMVAAGRMAANMYAGDKPWDIAAAKVIAEECGAIVTDLHGEEQRYDEKIRGSIVAHPSYFAEALTILSRPA